MVKADGYGHGAEAAARAALEAGAWGIAVSTAIEAEELRGLVERERLLALGGLSTGDAAEAVSAGCAVTCHSEEVVSALEAAQPPGSRLPVHLKVDTGMARLGCSVSEAPRLARRIAGSRVLSLAGVYTHFAASEADDQFTREQFEALPKP